MALLLAGGFLLRGLEQPLAVPAAAWRREQMLALSGRGALLSVLGGLRTAVAAGYWLRANVAWENRDAAAMEALIGLAVAADERPAVYWLNGARMLTYDVPSWLPAAAPSAVRQETNVAQARRALRLLEKGLDWHGPDAALHVEMANIYLRRLGDVEGAARCYRLAAGQPGAPYYAARIHAELLRALGRPLEALLWLRQILPALPVDDPEARRDVVRERIATLEHELAGR